MPDVRLTNTIAAPWTGMAPVRVGGGPKNAGTAERFVLVGLDEEPVLRVDVHVEGAQAFAFEEAIVWRDLVVVGLGEYVHFVSLIDRSAVSLQLDLYFGHLYPTDDYLLVASAERLHCIEPDRRTRWTSDDLGIDGVVVNSADDDLVIGEGEWDPPGGWRPFCIDARTGKHR